MSKARAILRDLACVAWLICIFWGGLSATPAFGYDGGTRGGMAYDGHFLSTSYYDGNEVLSLNENEKLLCSGQASFASFTKFLAAEETTTLSPYRMTTAGETVSHYGYAEQAANFQGGLRPGGFATSVGDLSGAEAQSGLSLRHATPPNAVYTVTPQPGTWVRVNPVTAPQFGQPGGLPEFQFPGGTGPGTVSPPRLIP